MDAQLITAPQELFELFPPGTAVKAVVFRVSAGALTAGFNDVEAFVQQVGEGPFQFLCEIGSVRIPPDPCQGQSVTKTRPVLFRDGQEFLPDGFNAHMISFLLKKATADQVRGGLFSDWHSHRCHRSIKDKV